MNADFYRQMLDGVANTRQYSPSAPYEPYGSQFDMDSPMAMEQLGMMHPQMPMNSMLQDYGVDFGGYQRAYDTMPQMQLGEQAQAADPYQQLGLNTNGLSTAGTDNPVVYDAFLGGY
jgi:hypothetical protein